LSAYRLQQWFSEHRVAHGDVVMGLMANTQLIRRVGEGDGRLSVQEM
jgi:hypothetical protein